VKTDGTQGAGGFDVPALLSNPSLQDANTSSNSIGEWLKEARPDAVFETTSLNPESGQPAIDLFARGFAVRRPRNHSKTRVTRPRLPRPRRPGTIKRQAFSF